MKKPLLISTFLLLGSLALSGCGGDPTSSSPSDSSSSHESSSSSSSIPLQGIDEFVSALSRDAYTTDEATGDFGLSDASNVGVIYEETQKTLYPIVSDAEFVGHIILLDDLKTSDLTAAGISLPPNVDLEDDYTRFFYAVTLAKIFNDQGSKVKINLPSRTLHIDASKTDHSTYCFAFDGLNGLYIQGNSTEFLISVPNLMWRGFLSFSNSQDIHLQGFSVDYSIPPALTGTVTSSSSETLSVTFSIPSEFNELVGRLMTLKPVASSYLEFDALTNAPRQGGNFATSGGVKSYALSGTSDSGYSMTVTLASSFQTTFTAPARGDFVNVAFAMYGYNGFAFSNDQNIYVEDVTLYTCPGMAFVGGNTENIFVNRFKLQLKAGSKRLMTATADGFHFDSCTGEVKITACLLENSHDDALNIKSGYYYDFSDFDAVAKTVTLTRKTSGMPTPKVNDVIEFYSANDFAYQGKLTVASVSGTSASYVVTVKESIGHMNLADWGVCRATFVSHIAQFTFKNNIIRNKRNRGILVQTRGAVIENNTFQNIGHGAISIHSSMDVFNEATVPQNMTIRNNKLINNNYLFGMYGDLAVFAIATQIGPAGTIKAIDVTNNFIAKNGNAGISFQGVGDSSIRDNFFFNCARATQSVSYEAAIEFYNASHITVTGNYNYNTLQSATFAGMIADGLTDPATIYDSGNDYLEYLVDDSEEVIVPISKLTSPITIDGNISDWASQGTTIEMDGSSLATGDPITPEEIADVFHIKMAKYSFDDTGVYFGFDVFDNRLDFKTQNNFWNGDCVEIFMSTVTSTPNADMGLYKENGGVLQAAFTPTWASNFVFAEGRTNSSIVENQSLAKVKVITTSEGYSGEAYFPFTLIPDFKTAIDAGQGIATAVIFADNDRDDIGRKRVQIGNVPHFVEAYKTKTQKMPRFVFGGN